MKWKESETPDFPVAARQTARLKVVRLQENEPDKNTPFHIDLTATIEESVNQSDVGSRTDTRFWLGTREDPMCEEPKTRRSRDWTKYKNFLRACGVSPTGETAEEAELVIGAEFDGTVGIRSYKKQDGSTGMSNTIYTFYKPGTKELALLPDRERDSGNSLDKTETSESRPERPVPRFVPPAEE